MNSFLRRTVPAALLAGGAVLVATAGAAGAQVPLPTDGLPTDGLPTEGLPTGQVDSLSSAPSSLCSGPLSALSDLSDVCDLTGEDQVQIGDSGVVPTSSESSESGDQTEQPESVANVDLQSDERSEHDCDEPGDDEWADDEPGECDEGDHGDKPCDECPPSTEPPTTEPPTTEPPTTEPPSTEPPTTAPPTTQVAASQPAEELPRTGSTTTPIVVAGASLLALGAGLVATKRMALGRRS
jgi:LPXTG-motif cell wall-anchored protein